MTKLSLNMKKDRRTRRIRTKIHGTAKRPRLSVFRSNKGIYAQLIDDDSGKTLLAASSTNIKQVDSPLNEASAVGINLAKKAQAAKISTIVFDRGAYAYQGRIKALAEGARQEGLKF